jgi:drug/metabolite transporter (DMT)-like permease
LHSSSDRPAWKTLLAFSIIYFAWGSTFLAIRVGVHEVPPLLFAALRFLIAGAALYMWTVFRGGQLPRGREWISICLLAFLIFVIDYGFLFWAEQKVPSGPAAVMMATIPAFIALSEIVVLRTQRLTFRLAAALTIGIAGVAVLTSHSLSLGGMPIDRLGALGLLTGSLSWSIASVLTRRLPLPASKAVSAGAQMLVGGAMLMVVSLVFGELPKFHPSAVSFDAWVALLYLIVVGSVVGFTAYVWLIHHESPTKVGTYAYVNPVVAVLLGYFFAGEALGSRTVLGTFFVLISVVVITTSKAGKPVAVALTEEAG